MEFMLCFKLIHRADEGTRDEWSVAKSNGEDAEEGGEDVLAAQTRRK